MCAHMQESSEKEEEALDKDGDSKVGALHVLGSKMLCTGYFVLRNCA